ncbi:(d)CMP kinase [Methylolobus aquaticus]
MSHVVPVLAIDGPSGSGKGTVSRAVARHLGWHFLDSGAIYRALGLAVERDGLSLDDQDAVARLAGRMDLRFSSGEPPSVWLDQIDVTDRIPTESCGAMASAVAALKPVRQALLQKQRDFRQLPGLVADGRDMGTVVFPDAEFKVFLTASAAVRAQRRHKQLKEKGVDVTLARLTKDIEERDERDRTRAEAPLRIADGALVIDSSDLGIDEVIARCLAVVGVL